METHFLASLLGDDLERETAAPWYNPDGDCIVYQTTDEAIVADRIDEILTIYRSASSGKAIGFQIKGINALSRKLGIDGWKVECQESEGELIELNVLLLAAYENGPRTIGRRQAYAGALRCAGSQVAPADPGLVPA